MRVHYFQHVSFEDPGYILTWLQQHNHTITSSKFYEADYTLPDINAIDVLIIMGGPMGVYDEQQFPWLKAEKEFIKDCITKEKKVLGICLGAQLIAACTGAKVYAAPNKEIGWFTVKPILNTLPLNWLQQIFHSQPYVFHWHGDQFEIPGNGNDLLESYANTKQAFVYNQHTIGLQFHLEVTTETLNNMLQHGAEELTPATYIQTAPAITETAHKYITSCNNLMSDVLQNWLSS